MKILQLPLLILFLFLSNILNGQGFELSYGDDEWGIMTFESPDKESYFIISLSFVEDNLEPLSITKIDIEGNVIFQNSYPFLLTDPGWGSFNKSNLSIENSSFWLALPNYDPLNSIPKINLLNISYDGQVISDIEYIIRNRHFVESAVLLEDKSVIFSTQGTITGKSNLSRISKDGDLLWTKKNIINSEIFVQRFVKIPNNEFLFLAPGFSEKKMYKFDYDGNLIWETPNIQNFGIDQFTIPFSDNNSYLLFGEDSIQRLLGARIAAIDKDGLLLWSKEISEHIASIDEKGIIQGENNSFYITGNAYLNNKSMTVLLQLDENGDVIWKKYYEELFTVNSGQLLRDNDDGFVIAGSAYPSAGQGASSDPYVIKTDKNGDRIWSYEKIKQDHYLHQDAIITSDNNYLIVGQGEVARDSGYTVNILKIDENGNVNTRLVRGKILIDENDNCTADPTEQPLDNWIVSVEGNESIFSNTNENGYFAIETNDDKITIKATPKNEFWEACPEEMLIEFDSAYQTIFADFTMQILEECPSLEIDISTPFLRRCFNNTYYVSVTNTGTTKAIAPTIHIELDSFFINPIFSNVNANINGNEVEIILPDLEVNEKIDFNFQVEVSCDADLGQEHCVYVEGATENDCDKTAFKGAYEYTKTIECQENIGAFDPNDKRAFSDGHLTERFIPADSTIEYQIRFQNTGTDTAFNIVVLDTLTELLDISSLRLGASSHPVEFEISEIRTLKFSFNNILLLDSLNHEPESHGFVKFKVKPVEGLLPRDIISNSASIYFDFNDPIQTNQLDLEIEGLSSVYTRPNNQFKKLNIFPQPASEFIHFELIDQSNLNHSDYEIEILNTFGQTILKTPLIKNSINISHLPDGNYFYKLLENKKRLEGGLLQIIKN